MKLPKWAGEYLLDKMNGLLETFKENLDSKKKTRDENRVLWAEFSLQTKQIFLNFFLILINNYLDFFLGLDELPANFDINQFGAAEVFDFHEYINVSGKDATAFTEQFASKTMMFNKFIEDTFKLIHKHKGDISHLDSQKDEISAFINLLMKLKEIKAKPRSIPKQAPEPEYSPHQTKPDMLSMEFTLVEAEQQKIIQESLAPLTKVHLRHYHHLKKNLAETGIHAEVRYSL